MAASALSLLLFAAPAHAAFPGQNGKIAFARSAPFPADPVATREIWLMNPDGISGFTRLTNNSAADDAPSWSPDGNKIAFESLRDGDYEIYVMNADGSGQTRLTNFGLPDKEPAWSPDGSKIVFERWLTANGSQREIYTMNADGTGVALLSSANIPSEPAWSPDGQKIAFIGIDAFGTEVWTMNADGSGQTRLSSLPSSLAEANDPNWSPDSQKIVFWNGPTDDEFGCGAAINVINRDGSGQTPIVFGEQCDFETLTDAVWSPSGGKVLFSQSYTDSHFYTVNPDGSGRATLVGTGFRDVNPDWQPVSVSSPAVSYDHPAFATPARVSLVPNFRQTISSSQCTARGGSTSTHGPPLAFASCQPPGFVPGTRAFFGPGSSSWASYAVVYGDTNAGNGDQADVKLKAALTDIRSSTGTDYPSNLTLVTKLRINDRYNGGSQSDPATVQDFDYQTPIACVATAGPEGANCNLDTSADAVTVGTIKENKATAMQVFRFRVNDSGANGVRGDSDDRTFATQGIYIP